MSAPLTIDPRVAARLGYDPEVILAAENVGSEDLPVEIALLAPGHFAGDPRHHFVIHWDCDPNKPEQGASAVEDCGEDFDAAARHYLERRAEEIERQNPFDATTGRKPG